MSPPPGRSLVPPRPNLGPEPWPDAGHDHWWYFGLGAAVCALAAIGLPLWRRGRRRPPASPQSQAETAAETPEGRLLQLAELARETLASRFGPSIRARTSEELREDPQLREALGESGLSELMVLLEAADRRKFAPLPSPDRPEPVPVPDPVLAELSAWEAWCRRLADNLARTRKG